LISVGNKRRVENIEVKVFGIWYGDRSQNRDLSPGIKGGNEMITKKRISIRTGTCFAAAVLLLFSVSCSKKDDSEGKTGVLCNQKYAFCGNVACSAVEGQPGKALCICEVLDGYSWGNTTCEQRKATDKTVVSTFAIAPSNPLVECPAGGQVVLCLDAKCTMEGPKSAKCMCTSQKSTTPYISGGGNCDTGNCSKQMLSGAPVGPARQIADDFSQALMAAGQTPGKLSMCK
jgi:hypothetical protein